MLGYLDRPLEIRRQIEPDLMDAEDRVWLAAVREGLPPLDDRPCAILKLTPKIELPNFVPAFDRFCRPNFALYEVGISVSPGAAAANLGNLWNANSSRHIWARELGLFIAATAVAADLMLARYGTRGTQSTTIVGQAQDPADVAATATVDSAWSASAPTVPSTTLRRINLPATVGAGVIWTWPPSGNSKGLKVAAAAGLQVWTATASTVIRQYWAWDE